MTGWVPSAGSLKKPGPYASPWLGLGLGLGLGLAGAVRLPLLGEGARVRARVMARVMARVKVEW